MKRIIVTVGPALFDWLAKGRLHHPSYLYRLNGAHGSVRHIEEHIRRLRQQIAAPDILIDLPGNKVRTRNLRHPIQLRPSRVFHIATDELNYPLFYKHLKKGAMAWANDGIDRFSVRQAGRKGITFVSHCRGVLHSNKGIHVRGIHHKLPFFFPKDEELINLANRHQVAFVGLSYVRNVKDLELARERLKDSVQIIAKVETAEAVKNLEAILKATEYILVDRGDLASDIGMEKVPACQKHIVERALFHNRKVFLATQFLKTMLVNPIPTIAELVDLYNTFKMGVYGIQLSEETAVGAHPEKCLALIQRMLREIAHEFKFHPASAH